MTVRHHGQFSKTTPGYQHAKEGDYVYGTNDLGIDTGVIIEGEGVLFIGQGTLREMVEVMGWNVVVDRDETVTALEQQVAFLEHEKEALEKRVAALLDDLAAFGRAMNDYAGRSA